MKLQDPETTIKNQAWLLDSVLDHNGSLIDRAEHLERRLAAALSHNTSLINRIDFWRGKAVYAFIAGLLVGSGAIAYATLDGYQILDRALKAVGQ